MWAGMLPRTGSTTGGAVSHGGKDIFEVGHANEIDHFLGSTETFNCGDCQIPQYGPLALGPNDPLTFIRQAHPLAFESGKFGSPTALRA